MDRNKRIQEQTTKLKKKNIEIKVKDELAFYLGIEPEDLLPNARLKEIVKHMWHANSTDPKQVVDRFDGIYYESEYYVQFLLRQVADRLKMELDLEKLSRTITTDMLTKIVWEIKGL